MPPTQPLPLDGVVVADFSTRLPGPLTTRVLAQLGATVWKVERPQGDVARWHPVFEYLNAGKRSVSLDLRDDADLAAARTLVRGADVLVEGFKPGTLARLGLGPEDARELNPALVYCSLSGFGPQGARREEAGHDLSYLALAGVLDRHRGTDGQLIDSSLPIPAADITAGLLAAIGIMGAIQNRRSTGVGTVVQVDLLSASLLLGSAHHAGAQNEAPAEPAHYGVFTTSDGRALTLAITAHEDHYWKRLCARVPQLQAWAQADASTRQSNRDDLRALISATIAAHSLDHWKEQLKGLDIPWAPLLRGREVAEDPHHQGRSLPGDGDALVPIGVDAEAPSPAPELDQHRAEFDREVLGLVTSTGEPSSP